MEVKRIQKLKNNSLLKEFFLEKPIKSLEIEYSIDQRKIRTFWKENFSSKEVTERGYRIKRLESRKRRISKDVVAEIYELLESGETTKNVSQKLNVSVGVVQKYVAMNVKLLEKVKNRNTYRRSENMKFLRKYIISEQSATIFEDKKKEVLTYFDTNLFLHEVAKKVQLGKTSIRNVFIEKMGKDQYQKRVERLEPLRIKKSMKSLILAGKLGSKPEKEFYKYISLCINTDVIHHDLDLMPPFEIDITLPKIKVAICWDGIGHFKPIFGEKIFKQVVYRDKQKQKFFEKIGWKSFIVQDRQSRWKKEEIICKVYEFVEFLNKMDQGHLFNEKSL